MFLKILLIVKTKNMKQITILAAFMLLASGLMAQIHFRSANDIDFSNIIKLKNDTLYIPAGSVKFIKLGDKVYKLVTSLEEVKQGYINTIQGLWHGGVDTTNFFNYPKTQLLWTRGYPLNDTLNPVGKIYTDSLILPKK